MEVTLPAQQAMPEIRFCAASYVKVRGLSKLKHY
jgi:hypothetical protein